MYYLQHRYALCIVYVGAYYILYVCMYTTCTVHCLCHNKTLATCFHSRYQQNFDLEGESGIVVRGIGTAVTVSAAVTSGGGGVATSPMSGSEGITPLRKQQ